jgi:hypothetical protein
MRKSSNALTGSESSRTPRAAPGAPLSIETHELGYWNASISFKRKLMNERASTFRLSSSTHVAEGRNRMPPRQHLVGGGERTA